MCEPGRTGAGVYTGSEEWPGLPPPDRPTSTGSLHTNLNGRALDAAAGQGGFQLSRVEPSGSAGASTVLIGPVSRNMHLPHWVEVQWGGLAPSGFV